MTARPVTAAQLRAYVDKARHDDARVVGFRAAPVWTENGSLGDGVVVAACPSTLAVRAAVWDHLDADDGRLLVVLTDRDDIGAEVVARLYRRQLLQPEAYEILKDLFRVSEIHQSLRDHQWLADLLVDVAPVGRTFAPPPGGILDLDIAWRALLTHGLSLPKDQPSLADLLTWAAGPSSVAALARLSEENVGRIADWLAERVGGAAKPVVHLIRAGRQADVVPFGLVAAVLWTPAGLDTGDGGRARFEVDLGDPGLSTVDAQAWGRAATELVRQAAEDPDQTAFTAWTNRATAVLTETTKTPQLIVQSPVLPAAFDARAERVGQTATDAIANPSEKALEAVSRAAASVREHVDAERLTNRVRTVDMVERLLRRLVRGPGDTANPADLAQAANAYVSEGAWVDDARLALLAGDPVSALGAAAHQLAKAVSEERAAEDRAFATRLAQWSQHAPTGTDPLIPIETVLDRVARPVVQSGSPVLVLLLDGLSWAQAHRMFDDIAGRRFRRVAPNGRWAPVVSTLPSVTQVSRSSLFAGRPEAGGQDVEIEGFAHHPGLLEVSKGVAPRLFHKASLYAVDGQPAPDVRAAVTDPEQQVVGVVVNGADDHLDKGGQLELADGLRAIKPMDNLLQWAMEGGRAVVVVADHGHIRETGSTVRPASGGGERWRPAEGQPAEDEVLLEGPRVLKGEGRIIAPATESVRYNATKKLGYHGGATPQEVLCPLAVFLPASVEIDGWLPALPESPSWWSEMSTAAPDLPAPAVPAEPPTDDKGVPTLFGADAEIPSEVSPAPMDAPAWVTELVESEVFVVQQQSAGRQTLDRDTVVHLLTQLDRAGGTLTGEAFALALGVSVSRARGKATALGALLNVDGYPAVFVNANSEVRIDRSVLRIQFGLSG
ncbi:bacteriophage (phiC31) resistance protein PglZ [Euzebya pacifica]|uniref:Bacteriophage (PhiC31) resistance protein PglZ n=1 Tax=Euzebya pacifica TaxID=1608957 RepID=A0A346XRX7_9ACTN|nr:BREX-2 system phosphatase PglZ [Euzebya pacifica]AXV04974.1 bacteriophage (phiC31) resistance protein PglZ [Euzebya pacifica]